MGASDYTFGDRKENYLDSYYEQALAAFNSISRISGPNTMIVQMIAFSEPSWQLPRYLKTMDHAGLKEVRFSRLANSGDGRGWGCGSKQKRDACQRGLVRRSTESVLLSQRG